LWFGGTERKRSQRINFYTLHGVTRKQWRIVCNPSLVGGAGSQEKKKLTPGLGSEKTVHVNPLRDKKCLGQVSMKGLDGGGSWKRGGYVRGCWWGVQSGVSDCTRALTPPVKRRGGRMTRGS